MKLQARKELLASDNSGLLLYYPQLRTNDFVSFFFCYTAASKRLGHARLKTVTPPPNRDDGDAGRKIERKSAMPCWLSRKNCARFRQMQKRTQKMKMNSTAKMSRQILKGDDGGGEM